MKQIRGFSLVETMVGIGIVSVVGLGMYTGFSQLDDAVNQNKARSEAAAAQGLLLSLLESDLSTHGQGITDANPPCLIDYNPTSNQWVNTCDGGLVSIPAPGVVTCKANPNGTGVLVTMTYRVTADDLSDATGNAQSAAEIQSQLAGTANPLDWVIRDTWPQNACDSYDSAATLNDYLNANHSFLNVGVSNIQGKLIEVNAAELGFNYANGNVNVRFTPNIANVLQTVGNSTVSQEVQTLNAPDLEAVNSLDPVADLPVVTFPYGVYLIRPSGSALPADIPTEIPVPIFRDVVTADPITVPFILEEYEGDGQWKVISNDGDAYQILSGFQPSQNAVALRVNHRIRLLSGPGYLLGDNPTAIARSTEAQGDFNDKLKARLIFPDTRLQRAANAMSGGVIALNRPLDPGQLPVSTNLRIQVASGSVCGPPPTGSFNFEVAQPGDNPAPLATCDNADIESDTGDYLIPINLNQASGPLNALAVTILANPTGREESVTFGVDPISDGSLTIDGPATQTLSFVNQGVLPEVSFVQSRATAIEPVGNESRGSQVTVYFDPPPRADMTLVLLDNTSQLTCHPSTGNYFFLNTNNDVLETDGTIVWRDPYSTDDFPVPTLPSGSCLDVGDGTPPLRPFSIRAGTESVALPIRLRPSDAIEHGQTIDLQIAEQPGVYTIGPRNTASVELEEYARVNFTAASATIDEDVGPQTWRTETLPLSIDPVLTNDLTAYINITAGNLSNANDLAANIPGDIQIPNNPQVITIPAGASSAQVPFQIENDVEFDRGKTFSAVIDRVVGGALPGLSPNPISGMPDHSILATIVDQDRCAIGAGLTVGSSPLDHFHSRGSSMLQDSQIDGATVRISENYDATTDRIILDGYEPVVSGNTETYTGVHYSAVLRGNNRLIVRDQDIQLGDLIQAEYVFDAVFTIQQGVLEITSTQNDDGGTTIATIDMVGALRDIVNYQSIGPSTGNRKVVFTLGKDVQAWDGHEDGTTHYYRFVSFPAGTAKNWTISRNEAASDANRFFGNQGYLATITSEGENQFLQRSFNINGNAPRGWAGGRSKVTGAGQNGDWYWTEGPEGQEADGLGRWFWRGGNNGRFVRTDNTQGTATSSCSSTNFDGTTIANSDAKRLTFGYSETVNQNDDVVVDPDRRFAIWRCNANSSREEPNGRESEARGLEFLGRQSFSQTWNDSTLTWADSRYLKGYYVEYGGPEKSDFEIRNLKLSQTSDFSAQNCGIDHGNLDRMCRAWPRLTANTGVNSDAGDFYSPGTLDDGAEVIERPRGNVNVYINHNDYNPDTDRLVLAGAPERPSPNTSMISYNTVSVSTDVPGDNTEFEIQGVFYINQGFLQLRASPGPTGRQWADVFRQVVEYQNTGAGPDDDYQSERRITLTLGDGIAWPYHPDGTTHFYRYVAGDGFTWTDARNQATSGNSNYYNVNGYLATITSEAEHEFLARNVPQFTTGAPVIAWLGGTDSATEGTWVWNDGPEAGQQFWSGALQNGRPILDANGAADTSELPDCQNQEPTRDGSPHGPDDVYVLDMLGSTSADESPFRYTKWSCDPSNISRPEPSQVGTSIQEDYLILSATAQGGQTWNDTTNTGATDDSWLDPKGYLAEFGGSNEFFNRSTSQTLRISPEQCVFERETNTAGCLPGAELDIDNDPSSGADFFGSNLTNSMTSRANVRIAFNTYVNESLTERDELALRGTTGVLSMNQLEKTYMNVPIGFAGVDSETVVSGTWNFTTGVMRLRSVNRTTQAEIAISAEAWVSFLNQRVQMLFAVEEEGADREIEFTLGDALAWPDHEDDTIHYYRFVAFPPGTANGDKEWTDSRAAAMSNTQRYFGVDGYLATITSLQENQFIASGFSDIQGNPAAGWVGGSDVDSEGNWIWMDGPEQGRRFHSGQDTAIRDNPNNAADLNGWGDGTDTTNCARQTNAWHLTNFSTSDPRYTAANHSDRILFWRNFGFPMDISDNSTGKRFSNWSCNGGTGGRQPSNSGSGGQDYLLITGSARGGGMWNDVGNEGIPGSGDLYTTTGYYVEYGGSGEFNNRKFSATVTVNNACEVQ